MPGMTLFENYEHFLHEHSDDFSTPSRALRVITENGMFRAYMDALTDGLSPNARSAVLAVANRQREVLLTETANVPGSNFALGWTVLSFPILVDIYAEPVISELCTVYPVSASIASIPRVKIMANIRGYDGNISEVRIPTMKQQVRPGFLELQVEPGSSNNVFSLATSAVAPETVTPQKYRISRRYTMITRVRTIETLSGGGTVDHDTNVVFRPDNRGQFVGTFTFTSNDSKTVVGTLTGHINYDSGILQFQVIYATGGSSSDFAADYAVLSVRFISVSTMNGRVVVKINTEMTDVTIDQNEDFMVELMPEDLQDFNAIYKIDAISVLSEAIKRQILLNKENDLAYFLAAAEADMAANGTAQSLNLADYERMGNKFEPDTAMDVFKAVIPKIAFLVGAIRRNYNMYPSYIVSGLKTAALLRSLQTFATNMLGIGQGNGTVGWTGDIAQFTKMTILESNAIADDKIYLATKAPADKLQWASIIDLVYQPLYIVSEITDGNTRNFIRSRSLIEVARTDGLGVITVSGLSTYFG